MSWKITIHWTAGTNKVSDLDKHHYHFIVDGDGIVHKGNHSIGDNSTSSGKYAAHVLGFNTKNIGIALAGMAGASESPFKTGRYPIKEIQLEVAAKLAADLSKEYGIPVEKNRIFTHAEVQPTFKVKQKGKWDLTRIPWDKNLIGHEAVGNYIRDKIRLLIDNTQRLPIVRSTLKLSSRGDDVRYLQSRLNSLGFNVGKVDGIFGLDTNAQVKLFQLSKKLDNDGVVGKNTWNAIG